VQKGQSVTQAAQKLAERHIRKSLANAVNPIADEIKQYIASSVEEYMPQNKRRKTMPSAIQEQIDVLRAQIDALKENVPGVLKFRRSFVQESPERSSLCKSTRRSPQRVGLRRRTRPADGCLPSQPIATFRLRF
jgi:hypothetical protein